jgi:hypothetical protein
LARDNRIKTCRGKPISDNRVAVTNDQILDHFRVYYQLLPGRAHLVMNVDEMGHQPYADANDIACFVPAEHEGTEVRYPVSGNESLSLVAPAPTGATSDQPLSFPVRHSTTTCSCTAILPRKLRFTTRSKGILIRQFSRIE